MGAGLELQNEAEPITLLESCFSFPKCFDMETRQKYLSLACIIMCYYVLFLSGCQHLLQCSRRGGKEMQRLQNQFSSGPYGAGHISDLSCDLEKRARWVLIASESGWIWDGIEAWDIILFSSILSNMVEKQLKIRANAFDWWFLTLQREFLSPAVLRPMTARNFGWQQCVPCHLLLGQASSPATASLRRRAAARRALQGNTADKPRAAAELWKSWALNVNSTA